MLRSNKAKNLCQGEQKIKLAKKYRPKVFEDMIGQQGPVRVLKASILHNKYHSAYLFSGPRGVGKTTAGRIFSKAILCASPSEGNPCGKCESCLLFEREQHFSYRELDAASYGGKDDMVKLRDEAVFLSVSKKKIILLDESHDISKAGQDALLKQTEECPEHLIYIFCTTEPDKMNSTLRDRCMEFQMSRVEPSLIADRLKYICEQENFVYQYEVLQMIAEKSDGHVRNAIGLLEEIAYVGDISLENFNIISKDYDEEIFSIIANLGKDINQMISTYKSISPFISNIKFYNLFISMISDSVKFLHGYEDFNERRKSLLLKLQEIHGYSLPGFLKYLITRDKYVDKVGLQSDLVILHHKFCANSFVPEQVQNEPHINVTQEPHIQNQKMSEQPSLKYSQIQKMGLSERCRVLREHRKNQNIKKEEENETVPSNWPLHKENRPGDNILDNKILSPEEFSSRLIGGRGRDVRQMVDPGTQ